MRVCVATTLHHPEDARIMHRQIRALLDAGHEVTYVAPFTHFNVTPVPPITAIDVRRGGVPRAALRRGAKDADLLILHEPELLLLMPFRHPPVVLDTRDEPAGPLGRRLVARAGRLHHVLEPAAAEATLAAAEPPPPGDTRVVHIGRLTTSRGAHELVELARRLAPHGIRLDLIGAAEHEVRPVLRDAQRGGLLDWYGYVPNRHALRMAEGALAGVCLWREPLTRPPTRPPTKVLDYMGRGVPVVTTPAAAAEVERAGCGSVVPYGNVDAAVEAVLDLKEDPVRRARLGAAGNAAARLHHHWPDQAAAFVARLERSAGVAHELAV
ncbi:glycosyltransferase [Nonomuraea sp. NPDC059194]|uniref:glycosyltransferase n=1 Tax=Nonomuraea sp. NPDC059194 TaxID=3346764 RepID=UPI00369B9A1B